MNHHLGGIYYKDKISDIVKNKIGPINSTLEICAGCGIIGQTLQNNNLTNKLTYSDVQDLSHIHENFILSDGLTNISDTYNLVICSPPWYNKVKAPTKFLENIKPIYWQDLNWKFHTNFYENIHNHIKPNGHLLITGSYDEHINTSWHNICKLNLNHTFIFNPHTMITGELYPKNYISWWSLP